MSKTKLFSSERVAELIKECAEAQSVDPSEILWNDFQTWMMETHGDVANLQRSLSKLGGYNSVRDGFYPPKPTLRSQEKRIISRHALVNRREGRQEASREIVLSQIEDFAKKCFKGRVTSFKPRKVEKEIDRAVTLNLSDLHIGSDINGLETDSGVYGVTEEARRIARVIYETAQFKIDHRARTRLVVALSGDLIENRLHDPSEGAPVAMQVCRAVHILTQALAYLASAFPEVVCYTISGNHDRMTSRHPGRAISGKYDSYSTIICFALKTALQHVKNLQIHIPFTPWVKWKCLGHNMWATHSDTVMSGHGYLGTNVSVSKLEHGIDRINATLPASEQAKVVLLAHAHIPLAIMLPNGVHILANGSTKPLDSYVASMNRMSIRNNSQTLFETTAKFAVGDYRNLRVGPEDDADASLDKIIQPFQGL